MTPSDLDVVEATRRCATRLEEVGLVEWADRLRLAIDAASTGGELAMAVRHHLRALRRSEVTVPAELVGLIDAIIATVDQTGW